MSINDATVAVTEELAARDDMIICEGVDKWYGDFQALKGVSATIKEREVVVALGPEGEEYYGYGWDVLKSSRGTTVVKHDGGNPYFLNNYIRYLDDDAVVYMMTNNPEFDAIERSYALAGLLFESE